MDAVDLGVNLFVALFALVDPIGNLPIFAAATAGATLRQRISVSALICLFAVVFLGFFFFTGLGLLQFFGISLPPSASPAASCCCSSASTWPARTS